MKKKIKNIFKPLIILISSFIFSFSLNLNTVFASNNTVYLVTQSEVTKNNTYYSYVYINADQNISSLNVEIYFDSSKISIGNTYNNISCSLYDSSINDGCLKYTYIFDGISEIGNQSLFYFYYFINSDAKLGDTYFDIVVSEAYDNALEVVELSGSRTSLKIIEQEQIKIYYVYGTSSINTSVKKEFTLDYSFSDYSIVSGAIQITYDKELFELIEVTQKEFLTSKLVDINTSIEGTINLSFLGTEYNYNRNILSVRFKTLKNVNDVLPIIFNANDLYDLNLNKIKCNEYQININIQYDLTYLEDLPSMSLVSELDKENNLVNLLVKLDASSSLGAGDFEIRFDNSQLTFKEYKKEFNPSFFNVNTKNASEGIIKYSIISLENIMNETNVINIVFDVSKSCYNQNFEFTITGSGLADSLTNSIKLNFINSSLVVERNHTSSEAVIENKVESTCTEEGSYEEVVYCKDCDHEISRTSKTIEALGHDYGDEWTIDKEADCCNEGLKSHHCSRCDSVSDETVIPKLEHEASEALIENRVEPTCTKEGSYEEVVYCKDCNHEISRTSKTIEALGHDYKDTVVPATEGSQGYTEHNCKVCGHSYNDNYVDYQKDQKGLIVIGAAVGGSILFFFIFKRKD